jgi:hypothetical protein
MATYRAVSAARAPKRPMPTPKSKLRFRIISLSPSAPVRPDQHSQYFSLWVRFSLDREPQPSCLPEDCGGLSLELFREGSQRVRFRQLYQLAMRLHRVPRAIRRFRRHAMPSCFRLQSQFAAQRDINRPGHAAVEYCFNVSNKFAAARSRS